MHKEKIMYLKYVQIINYKNLKNIRFEFSKGANTIIGENDSGKSNALTAIRILLMIIIIIIRNALKKQTFHILSGIGRDIGL